MHKFSLFSSLKNGFATLYLTCVYSLFCICLKVSHLCCHLSHIYGENIICLALCYLSTGQAAFKVEKCILFLLFLIWQLIQDSLNKHILTCKEIFSLVGFVVLGT